MKMKNRIKRLKQNVESWNRIKSSSNSNSEARNSYQRQPGSLKK